MRQTTTTVAKIKRGHKLERRPGLFRLPARTGQQTCGWLRLPAGGDSRTLPIGRCYRRGWHSRRAFSLVADRAEMLADAEHDQNEFGDDARKDDPDHDAGDRRQ